MEGEQQNFNKIVTMTSQARDHSCSALEDEMTASGKARGGQEERHVFNFLSSIRVRPCEGGPQITSCRGSPTYTVFSLTHVTCHSFQVSNQPAPSSSLRNSLQRTGHEPCTVLETDFSTNLGRCSWWLTQVVWRPSKVGSWPYSGRVSSQTWARHDSRKSSSPKVENRERGCE